jgi:hypothetical protein
MSVHVHLSPRINHVGCPITLPKNDEWIHTIEYIELFMAFQDLTIGQRFLVNTEIRTLGSRESIYMDCILTRIQGGWSRHLAVFYHMETHPYLYHISMYVEVEKRKGTWKGFQLA